MKVPSVAYSPELQNAMNSQPTNNSNDRSAKSMKRTDMTAGGHTTNRSNPAALESEFTNSRYEKRITAIANPHAARAMGKCLRMLFAGAGRVGLRRLFVEFAA